MTYGSVLTDTVQSSTAATAPTFKDGNGTQIGTLCRAWVNFNGTGTVAIRASFNVSSITDIGTGNYTVNFTNALPDANYSVVGTGDTNVRTNNGAAPTTTAASVQGLTSGGSLADGLYFSVAVFR